MTENRSRASQLEAVPSIDALYEILDSEAILESTIMEGNLLGGFDLFAKLKNLPAIAKVRGRSPDKTRLPAQTEDPEN